MIVIYEVLIGEMIGISSDYEKGKFLLSSGLFLDPNMVNRVNLNSIVGYALGSTFLGGNKVISLKRSSMKLPLHETYKYLEDVSTKYPKARSVDMVTSDDLCYMYYRIIPVNGDLRKLFDSLNPGILNDIDGVPSLCNYSKCNKQYFNSSDEVPEGMWGDTWATNSYIEWKTHRTITELRSVDSQGCPMPVTDVIGDEEHYCIPLLVF